MRRRIFLSQAPTNQGTVHRMTRDLGAAFEARGYEACYWEATSEASIDALREGFRTDGIAAFISMNLYTEFMLNLARPCTEMRIPVFFYCFDNPYIGVREYRALLDAFPDIVISLTGSDELAAAERIFGRPDNFTVLRQAVSPLPPSDPDLRDLDGVLIGNNVNVEGRPMSAAAVRRSWADRDDRIAKVLDTMVEMHHDAPLLPLADLAWRAIPPSMANISTSASLLNEFDFYMRSKVREDAIVALLDHDVTICGQGWDHLIRPGQRARFLGSTPNAVCYDLMRRARCLFNIVPEYYSCSERVLEAAMIGCPVVTTRSRFFEEEFGDSLLYSRTATDLPALMAEAGNAQVMAGRVARAGEVVRRRHTWDHRAGTILDTLARRGFPLG